MLCPAVEAVSSTLLAERSSGRNDLALRDRAERFSGFEVSRALMPAQRLHAELAVQFRRIIGIAVLQHQSHIAHRGYVLGGITVDEDQIGPGDFAFALVETAAQIDRQVIRRRIPRTI